MTERIVHGRWDDEEEDAPPVPLTPEQAQALRAELPSISAWQVVAAQAVAGGFVAALCFAFGDRGALGWSALYGAACVVGSAYLTGAVVPVFPVLIGATDALFSVLTAGLMVVLVSTILSFLSGMDIKRRIMLNLVIITVAVSISYGIGIVAKSAWGI